MGSINLYYDWVGGYWLYMYVCHFLGWVARTLTLSAPSRSTCSLDHPFIALVNDSMEREMSESSRTIITDLFKKRKEKKRPCTLTPSTNRRPAAHGVERPQRRYYHDVVDARGTRHLRQPRGGPWVCQGSQCRAVSQTRGIIILCIVD